MCKATHVNTSEVPPQIILCGNTSAAFDDEAALETAMQLGNKETAFTKAAFSSRKQTQHTLKDPAFFWRLTTRALEVGGEVSIGRNDYRNSFLSD